MKSIQWEAAALASRGQRSRHYGQRGPRGISNASTPHPARATTTAITNGAQPPRGFATGAGGGGAAAVAGRERNHSCMAALARAASWRSTSTLQRTLPRRIAGIDVPQDVVSRSTWQWAHRALPAYLLTHSVRAYCWGAAIASRELEHGADNRAELRVFLARLYPEAPDTASLDDLQRRFARDLRAGRFDNDEQAHLRALLRGRTRLRLKVSAPGLCERVRTP